MRNDRYTEAFHKNREWVAALDAFDYADSEPLSEMIAKRPIPIELRPQICRIVSGERKPNRKAAVKLHIPARDRMEIAQTMFAAISVLDQFKFGEFWEAEGPGAEKGMKVLQWVADERNEEPLQSRRYLERTAKCYFDTMARSYKVSPETIENLLRDYRKKIEDYPDV